MKRCMEWENWERLRKTGTVAGTVAEKVIVKHLIINS